MALDRILVRSLKLRDGRSSDMTFIRDCTRRFRLDDEDLRPEQFVVAEIADEIVGFGRIKPYDTFWELGCLGVVEHYRGRGIADAIVKELIRRFPNEDIWVTTDIPGYCERFGFTQSDAAPPALHAKIRGICQEKGRPDAVIMLLRKSRISAWLTGPPLESEEF
jgi:N-acetylglutamate synthase-like GNAT family acetyltransferase